MRVTEPTIHIKINQDDWAKIRTLVFDEKGIYRPEIANVETGWNQPFDLWLYMPEGKPLLDLMKEEDIDFEQCKDESPQVEPYKVPKQTEAQKRANQEFLDKILWDPKK